MTTLAPLPSLAVPASPRGWAARLDAGIGTVVGMVSAGLVVVEIVILFAGILARYVFHRPLVWSDELASILFLWLAMLGSVLAFRASEHMRMTALVSKASGSLRRFLELIALFATVAFLLFILQPAIDYVQDEAIVSMPALDISTSWRAAAMPIGIALMIATSVLRIGLQSRGEAVLALAIVVAMCGIMVLLQPTLIGLGKLNLIIFFLGVVPLTVFAGVPIAFSFGLGDASAISRSRRISRPRCWSRGSMPACRISSCCRFRCSSFSASCIEMTGMAA